MIKLLKLGAALGMLSILLFSACTGNLSQSILFEDEFDSLPLGIIELDSAAYTNSYFFPGFAQFGSWTVGSIIDDERYFDAWEIVQGEEGNYLRQNSHLLNDKKDLQYPYTHPIVSSGDSIWHDYKIEFEFSPEALMDKCGIIFKYQNNRSYYFYGMEGNQLVIKLVQHSYAPHRPYEKILASMDYSWEKGKMYSGDVSIRENRIYSLLNDSIILIAEDNTFQRGEVGILSDVPASFYSLKVTTLNSEKKKINRFRHQKATEKAMLISENPMPALWKKIETPLYGSGGNLRFGDINSDGEKDIVIGQARYREGSRSHYSLSCLTAVDTKGEVLWQKGKPLTDRVLNCGDLPFQIHDLDGDGTREVICVMDYYLRVLDGQSGKSIRRVRTPGIGNRIESIYFMDVQGKGRDSDIVLKDWDNNIWIYDEHLKLLWNKFESSGKTPFAIDLDGNGKDELLMGYSLFSDKGDVIWNFENGSGGSLNCSGIIKVKQGEEDAYKYVFAAGDWGLMSYDIDASLERHLPIGHVNRMMQANLRDDLPGLEMVSLNSWASQGLIHFYDAEGNIYHSIQSGPNGGTCIPVNWKGDGEEYVLLNTNPGNGGLLNAFGEVCVVFPDDGHADLSARAIDLHGDGRDEIITWNKDAIWIYTQHDSPRQGKVYEVNRSPEYNYSNFAFKISESPE